MKVKIMIIAALCVLLLQKDVSCTLSIDCRQMVALGAFLFLAVHASEKVILVELLLISDRIRSMKLL